MYKAREVRIVIQIKSKRFSNTMPREAVRAELAFAARRRTYELTLGSHAEVQMRGYDRRAKSFPEKFQ
jgi:hypothetical protein